MLCQGAHVTVVMTFLTSNARRSRPDVFCRKGVLKNVAIFTGNHLCQSIFFNKVAGLFVCNTSGGYFCNTDRPLLKQTGQIKNSNLVTAVESSLAAWIKTVTIN